MTIIVTGGAGFIGSNFIFYMMKAHPDYRLVCLDKLTYAGNLSTLKSVLDMPSFRFVRGDICDRELVYSLFDEEHPAAALCEVVPELFLFCLVKAFQVKLHFNDNRTHRSVTGTGFFAVLLDCPVLHDAC